MSRTPEEYETLIRSLQAQLDIANERVVQLDGDLAEVKSENERLKAQLTSKRPLTHPKTDEPQVAI